jgi:hypothetical protein
MGGIPSTIGLIAGNGQFPLLFARAARLKGIRVIAAAAKGDTSLLVHFFADEVRWFSPGDLGQVFAYFRSRQVRHILMAGQIHPRNLFEKGIVLDADFKALFEAMADRRCDTIFGAVANRLKKEGMEILDSTFLLNDHLAPKGTLTKRAPTEEELDDIDFEAQRKRLDLVEMRHAYSLVEKMLKNESPSQLILLDTPLFIGLDIERPMKYIINVCKMIQSHFQGAMTMEKQMQIINKSQ